MIGIILAGGYGTRLYPLMGDTPKALLPLGDTTPLDLILANMSQISSLDKILITINARHKDQFMKWQAKNNHRALDMVVEPHTSNGTKYGAVKALNLLMRDIHDACLVITCDNVFSSSLIPLTLFESKDSSIVAIYNIKDLKKASQFSTVTLNEEGKIVSFIEKPKYPKSTLIGTGIYLFSAHTLPRIQEYVTQGLSNDQPGKLIEWLYKVEPVYGYTLEGYWNDIGTPESYLETIANNRHFLFTNLQPMHVNNYR